MAGAPLTPQKLFAELRPSAGAESGDRLTDAQFQQVADMVGRLTGIVIKEHKREMIHSRLSRRLRARSLSTFKEYLDLLSSPAGESELGELINAVTTNLTSFFREKHHFDHLRDKVIAPMAASGAQRLRIWSSAASSGEEPYSIAMTVMAAPGFSKFGDARMLATDIDTNILARAEAGRYPADRVAAIPDALRSRYLDPAGEGFAFKSEVKRFISFRQLNLLHDWPMSGPFDVIFCRNVLIYFDAPTKRAVVDRMVRMIRPDGVLYLGHSESLLGDHPLLRSEGQTIYRRLS
ncbi:MAG: protein-glutamate O-methyltransferase [Pseudomonadota bacterium]